MLQAAAQREMQLKYALNQVGLPPEGDTYVRPPAGPGYKELGLSSDYDWKAHLKTAPFEVRKWFEMSFVYQGGPPRSIRLMRLTEGRNDYYLRAWCLRDGIAKIFALGSVGPLATETGDVFSSGASWLNALPRLL